jgi:hypothetical protein
MLVLGLLAEQARGMGCGPRPGISCSPSSARGPVVGESSDGMTSRPYALDPYRMSRRRPLFAFGPVRLFVWDGVGDELVGWTNRIIQRAYVVGMGH